MKYLAYAALWLGALPIMAAAQNVQDVQLQNGAGGASGARTVPAPVPDGGFCVVNGADVSLLFITETREGVRRSAMLAPGARLYAAATLAENGIVSVFESSAGFEGCSRIVAVGKAEEMQQFAQAGRCGWRSHNS